MTARITVTGNAVTAPLVRITGTGRKVTNFRIGSTERRQDKGTGEWVDGNKFFVGVACWGTLADNVERSVRLGMPLVVTGKILQRTYTDAEDKVQFAYEIQADTVSPDLNRGTSEFTRVNRTSGPSVSVGSDGQPLVGVAASPFDADRELSDGVYTVLDDGSFGSPAPVEGDAPGELTVPGPREPALAGSRD